MVVHTTCDSNTGEAEAGESKVQGQQRLHRLPLKTKEYLYKCNTAQVYFKIVTIICFFCIFGIPR